MYGEADSISFPYAHVSTEDNRLQISSTGQLRHLKGKHKLIINFNVSRMLARKGVAEKVINQFKSKKLMMKLNINLSLRLIKIVKKFLNQIMPCLLYL